LKPFPRTILFAIVLSFVSAAATPVSTAGSKYFDQALRSLKDGNPNEAATAADKGWAALLAAGPVSAGFLDGVYEASGVFATLGRALRAEAVYTEAEALCAAPNLQLLKRRLEYIHIDYLIRFSEYVKAEGILRTSLAAENRAAQKGSLYVAFVQSLAFIREQQGDPDGAEVLYRSVIAYPSPDLSAVAITQTPRFARQSFPFIGDPRLGLALYYSGHKRIKEAEALYRARLADPSLIAEEHIEAMRELLGFLMGHGSKTDAMVLQEQIIALRKTQPLTTPELRDRLAQERYALANMEVNAGRSEDAKALLESDLQQAASEHGKNSPEYGEALNYLFENRSLARDYESAEDLAREEVQRAEMPGAAARVGLVPAMFRLADTLRAEGKVAEVDALTKRTVEMNRASIQQPVSEARFAEAEALVRARKPGEAVQMAREISGSPAPPHEGPVPSSYDQFGFRHLAQLMIPEHKAEAAHVSSIALLTDERRYSPTDRALARELTDWAGFYRGLLGDRDRARDLLTRAETIVGNCCGVVSPMMEPVLQERVLLEAPAGQAASIPYLEQLRALRVSIYGEGSRQVEETTHELVAATAKAGR
jgi:tetratricopeptide (TPR) repeat protein